MLIRNSPRSVYINETQRPTLPLHGQRMLMSDARQFSRRDCLSSCLSNRLTKCVCSSLVCLPSQYDLSFFLNLFCLSTSQS